MANPHLISEDKCTGCSLCMTICSVKHLQRVNPKEATLKVIEKFFSEDLYGLNLCKQCGICARVCPEDCIIQDSRGVYIIEDPDQCTGCEACVNACPFDVLVMTDANKLIKCDLCQECVRVCPYHNLKVKE